MHVGWADEDRVEALQELDSTAGFRVLLRIRSLRLVGFCQDPADVVRNLRTEGLKIVESKDCQLALLIA